MSTVALPKLVIYPAKSIMQAAQVHRILTEVCKHVQLNPERFNIYYTTVVYPGTFEFKQWIDEEPPAADLQDYFCISARAFIEKYGALDSKKVKFTRIEDLVADIRNKLTPFWNLVAVVRGDFQQFDVKKEAETAHSLEGNITKALEDINIENERLHHENRRLTDALTSIAFPIAHLQGEAAKEGSTIDGNYAMQISNDPAYLKQLAQNALK